MTDVFALDIATTTGWARGPVGGVPRCGSIRFAKPGASHLAIVGRALEWSIATFKPPLPDVVAIEALVPPQAMRGKTNVDHDLLAMLHGVIMATLFLRGVYTVHRYPVQTIRSHFIDLAACGRGQGKVMVQEKCRALGWVTDYELNHDAADALACWSYQVALIYPQHAINVSPLFGPRGVRLGV